MQQKYQGLETQLRGANWEHLKTYKQIYMRVLFKSFGDIHLRKLDGQWAKKLKTFLRNNEKALDEWHFENRANFEEIYWNLYHNLNKNAHPLFIKADSLELPDELFEKSELRLLGFMWDMCKYPLDNFMIEHSSKPAESIATLKKGYNPNESVDVGEIQSENV